jgi:hypothetical protein
MPIVLFIVAALLAVQTPPAWPDSLNSAGSRFALEWRGRYTAQERIKLRRWLQHAGATAANLYGALPRTEMRIILERTDNASEPVPYAQVIRSEPEGVKFYLDPTYPLPSFFADWTAVHELIHLYIPYPGAQDLWLSEGLATYYQNVLRARVGILSPTRAWQKLHDGFQRGLADNRNNHLPLADLSASMRHNHAYMRVYWSGTAFFLEADLALRQASGNRQSLDSVLQAFVGCCLATVAVGSGPALVAALDTAAGRDVFTALYRRYSAAAGMPDFQRILGKLGIEAPGGKVSLLPADKQTEAIRAAIMRPTTAAQRTAATAAKSIYPG